MGATANALIALSLIIFLLIIAEVFLPKDISELLLISLALILVISVSVFLSVRLHYGSMRLIILGIALILAGVALWYFADKLENYAGVWAGITMVIAGTIIWIWGDEKGGALNKQIAKYMSDISAERSR